MQPATSTNLNTATTIATKTAIGASRAKPSVHDQLTEQAQKWVAQTFYGTMLKQMRNSPFKSELFEGGRGGEMFGALMDQQLADRMSQGVGGGLVRAIVRRLEAAAAYKKSGAARPDGPNDARPPSALRTQHPELLTGRSRVAPTLRA